MPQVMSEDDVGRALRRIAHEILERHRGPSNFSVIGIHTRGAHLGRRLVDLIESFEGEEPPFGTLDVSGHRDDRAIRAKPTSRGTNIDHSIDNRGVVVVDDVLFTGRTVRAAMDALTDQGRAAMVQLAVLVDRGHRELPIRPDYVGKNLPTSLDERVTVRVAEEDGVDGVWIEKV